MVYGHPEWEATLLPSLPYHRACSLPYISGPRIGRLEGTLIFSNLHLVCSYTSPTSWKFPHMLEIKLREQPHIFIDIETAPG